MWGASDRSKQKSLWKKQKRSLTFKLWEIKLLNHMQIRFSSSAVFLYVWEHTGTVSPSPSALLKPQTLQLLHVVEKQTACWENTASLPQTVLRHKVSPIKLHLSLLLTRPPDSVWGLNLTVCLRRQCDISDFLTVHVCLTLRVTERAQSSAFDRSDILLDTTLICICTRWFDNVVCLQCCC